MTTSMNPVGLGPLWVAPTTLTYSSANDETTLDLTSGNFYPFQVGETLFFTSAPLTAKYIVKGITNLSNIHRDADVSLAFAAGKTTVTLSSGTFPSDTNKLYFVATQTMYDCTYQTTTTVDITGDITATETDHECSHVMPSVNTTDWANDKDADNKVVVIGDASGESGQFRITGDGDTYNDQLSADQHADSTIMKAGVYTSAKTQKKYWAWIQFARQNVVDFGGGAVNFAKLTLIVSSSANIGTWWDFSTTGNASHTGSGVIDLSADSPSSLAGVRVAATASGTAASWTSGNATITLDSGSDLSNVTGETHQSRQKAHIWLDTATHGGAFEGVFPVATVNDTADTLTVRKAPTNTASGKSWHTWNRDTSIIWLEGGTNGDIPGMPDRYSIKSRVASAGSESVTLNVVPTGTLTGNWNIDEPIGQLNKTKNESDLNFPSMTNSSGGQEPPGGVADAWAVTCGDSHEFERYVFNSVGGVCFFRLVPTSGTTLTIGRGSNSLISGQTETEQEDALQEIVQRGIDVGDVSVAFMIKYFNSAWDGLEASFGPRKQSWAEYKSSADASSANWPLLELGMASDEQISHTMERRRRKSRWKK